MVLVGQGNLVAEKIAAVNLAQVVFGSFQTYGVRRVWYPDMEPDCRHSRRRSFLCPRNHDLDAILSLEYLFDILSVRISYLLFVAIRPDILGPCKVSPSLDEREPVNRIEHTFCLNYSSCITYGDQLLPNAYLSWEYLANRYIWGLIFERSKVKSCHVVCRGNTG